MKSAWLIALAMCATLAQAQPWDLQVLWEREGAEDSSLYGNAILPLGDQNSDGFTDWAVFASGTGPAGQPQERKVEFFHGGNPPAQVPYMIRALDPVTETEMGYTRVIGDVNGDGYVDWVTYVRRVDDPRPRIFEICYGGPEADTFPEVSWGYNGFLLGLSPIGDFNGDGFDDLMFFDGINDTSAIFLGGSPMDTIPDWFSPLYLLPFGYGDLNGDGYSDFVSEAYGFDLWGFLGGTNLDTIPDFHWQQLWQPFIVADLNGDHRADLISAAPGRGDVRFGSAEMGPDPDTNLLFPCGGEVPHRICSAGDVNNDGYNDLLMLTEGCDPCWGLLTLHLGHPWLNPDPVLTICGWTPPLDLIGIWDAAGLGDVNGDGIGDFGVGAWTDMAYQGWRGKAVVISGDDYIVSADDIPSELPSQLTMSIYPNPFNSTTTLQIVVPGHAAQVELTIYNLVGQSVFHTTLSPVSGRTQYALDASAFSSGLYLLRASSGPAHATSKLMILK